MMWTPDSFIFPFVFAGALGVVGLGSRILGRWLAERTRERLL